MVLQDYGVTIDLVGTTFISKAGVISSTFKIVPDQPVTSFELTLPEGPYSALTALGNLCAAKKTVTVKKKVTAKVHGRRKTITRKVKQTVGGRVPDPLQMPTEFVAQNGAESTRPHRSPSPAARRRHPWRRRRRAGERSGNGAAPMTEPTAGARTHT